MSSSKSNLNEESMPPKKGSKKTETAPPAVTTEAGLAPTPVTGLPDLGSMDPSKTVGPANSPNLLEQTPGQDNPLPGDGNTIAIDGVNLNLPNLPTSADLQKDLASVMGGGVGGSLGDNMLPILTAKVDQLRESLTASLDKGQETLVQEFNARLNALTADVLFIKKGQSQLQACINEEVLPSLVRIEGFLQGWADGDASAEAIVTTQEATQVHPTQAPTTVAPAVTATVPPALEQQQAPSGVVSDNVRKWLGLYAQHMPGTAMDANMLASQFLTKHAAEFVPAMDTPYNLIAHIRSLGWYNDKTNTVTFPAKQG